MKLLIPDHTSRHRRVTRLLPFFALIGAASVRCDAQLEQPTASIELAQNITLTDCQASSLIYAITTANASGVGPHTIALKCGCTYTLSTINNYWYGANALPAIVIARSTRVKPGFWMRSTPFPAFARIM